MTTVWLSSMSRSLKVPLTVATSFSLMGGAVKLVTTGLKLKLLVKKYSPEVPLSLLTRTLYVAPGVSPVATRDSLRPSSIATPLAISVVPALSYRSNLGLRVFEGSPEPSPGVLVCNRTAFAATGTVNEYQSKGTVCKTSWTELGAPLNANIVCTAVPANVVSAPPMEKVDPIAAFRAAMASALSVIVNVVLLSAADTTRCP